MRYLSTLQRTLSVHFLLVAIVPMLLFGTVALTLLDQHLQKDIHSRNRMLAQDIATSTEQFLVEVELDLLAAAEIIDAGSIVRPESIDRFLEAFVRRSVRFESIYRLGSDYRVKNLGLDPQLNLRGEDYADADFSHHRLLQAHPVIDRPLWSDTFVSLVTGEPSVTLAVPLKDGALLGNVSLMSLSKQLAKFAMEGGDSCAVIDHKGTLVASSLPNLAMQRVNYRDHAVVEKALQGRLETVIEKHDETQLLESTASVPRSGWVAWVGVDLNTKMKPVDYVRNLLVGILAATVVPAAGLALFDARRLMRPLADLSEKATQIGAGHYDIDLPAIDFAEIDKLASALKEMSTAVGEREQSLVSSEQRFRDLVDSIDGVVWEMDVKSREYLFVSRQIEALSGYVSRQWLADPDLWGRLVHPEDRPVVVVGGRRGLALNDKHDLEYRIVALDGKTVWVRDLVTLVWEGDEPNRLLGVMVDVTRSKLAEQELERYRAHLEELVEQRTRELQAAQKQLVEKERLAVLGQLTATVSHEIRNPLGTVANTLYALRETLGEDCLGRVERPMALAERSVQRCDGIISELLDFTRRRDLVRESLAIDPWLEAMLDELSLPEEVRCHRKLHAGITLMADPERLRRALINVVTNAVQAMEGEHAGEKRLTIETRRHDARCEIIVTDTGCGIPEEIMARIYEPLFSTKNFGVGLGVPIIRNIMRDHGGDVEYRSQVGQGTTVTLWLPLLPGSDEA